MACDTTACAPQLHQALKDRWLGRTEPVGHTPRVICSRSKAPLAAQRIEALSRAILAHVGYASAMAHRLRPHATPNNSNNYPIRFELADDPGDSTDGHP